MREFSKALLDPTLSPTALRVALVVGSLLFTVNHGAALAKGEMNRIRWFSGLISYVIPYGVNIHGQHSSRSRSSTSN